MAAPSTPVIQGVNPVYPFGSNVHATWVTDTSVTSGATTLYSGSTVVSTQAASLFDYDAYTKTWKVSYPIAATGTYAIGVTATNGDGTSDEATAQFVVAEYSGIVLSPSGTVTGLPINVAWSIDDPNGVATQNIVFQPSDYSSVMYSATMPPTQRTLTLGAADLAGIENGTSYEIRLHVTNGVGLVTTVTSTITTSWAAPVTPTATVTTDPDTLAASVIVTGDRTYEYTDVESFTAPESGIITSLNIDGKSVQDGTPTPSAPVPIKSVQSVNRISPTPWRIGASYYGISTNATLNPTSDGGVTVTENQDGTLTLSVTTANRGAVFLTELLPAGTYLRNVGELAGGDSTTRLSFYRLDKNMKVLAGYNISNGASLAAWPFGSSTLTEDGYFALALGSTTAGKTLTLGRMFVAAIDDMTPPFDRYGCISVATHGKNLLDTDSLNILGNANGGKAVAADGTISAVDTASDTRANNSYGTSDYICWLEAGTYTVSVDVVTASSNVNSAFIVRKVSDNTATVSHQGASAFSSSFTDTFTLSERTQVYFFFKLFTAKIRIQLEAGSTATEYQPYDGTATPIDLQGHALRSLPDGTHDELTVDSAGVVTLTQRVGTYTVVGTESYVSAASMGTYYRINLQNSLASAPSRVTGSANSTGLCTYAPVVYGWTSDTLHAYTNIKDIALFAVGSSASDVLAAYTGAEFVYPLATPQTITLGTITPPFVAEGATVAIDAAVTPNFDATMRAAQSAGTPLTDTLMVVRVSPDGTRWVVASDMESGDTCVDPLPPLGVEYAYEVTGIAATGVPSAPATVTHANVTTCWAMNFGVDAAEVVLARFNPKASYSMEQGGELYHFADGGEGDGLPVWYGTTEREIGGSVSWDTLTQATADRLNALMLRYPVGWLRDPFGHMWRARMKPKFSHGIGKLWQVAIDWDAVR